MAPANEIYCLPAADQNIYLPVLCGVIALALVDTEAFFLAVNNLTSLLLFVDYNFNERCNSPG